jgi:hypothetical protein
MTTEPQMPSLLAPQAVPAPLPSDAEIAGAILRQLAIRAEARRIATKLLAEDRFGVSPR